MSGATERAGRRRHTARTHTAEDQALNQIAKEAESRLAAKRAERAQAREIRMRELERLQKESEDKADRVHESSSTDYSRPSTKSSRLTKDDTPEETTRDLKGQLYEVEDKYKKAMMTTALLDNEKQALLYQVDLLKDKLDDEEERLTELLREHKDKCRQFEAHKRTHTDLERDFNYLKEQLSQRDKLIKDYGLVIIGSESGELSLAKNPDSNGPVVQLGAALVSPEAAKILEQAGDGSLGTCHVSPGMPEHVPDSDMSPKSQDKTTCSTNTDTHITKLEASEESNAIATTTQTAADTFNTKASHESSGETSEVCEDNLARSPEVSIENSAGSHGHSSEEDSRSNEEIVGSHVAEDVALEKELVVSESEGSFLVEDSDDKLVECKNEDEVSNQEEVRSAEETKVEVEEKLNTSITSESTSTEADSDSDIFMDAVEEAHGLEGAVEARADSTEVPVIVVEDDSDNTCDEDTKTETQYFQNEVPLLDVEDKLEKEQFKSVSEEPPVDNNQDEGKDIVSSVHEDSEIDVDKDTLGESLEGDVHAAKPACEDEESSETCNESQSSNVTTEQEAEDSTRLPLEEEHPKETDDISKTPAVTAELDHDVEEETMSSEDECSLEEQVSKEPGAKSAGEPSAEDCGNASSDECSDPVTEESEIEGDPDDDDDDDELTCVLLRNNPSVSPATVFDLDRPEMKLEPEGVHVTKAYDDARHSGILDSIQQDEPIPEGEASESVVADTAVEGGSEGKVESESSKDDSQISEATSNLTSDDVLSEYKTKEDDLSAEFCTSAENPKETIKAEESDSIVEDKKNTLTSEREEMLEESPEQLKKTADGSHSEPDQIVSSQTDEGVKEEENKHVETCEVVPDLSGRSDEEKLPLDFNEDDENAGDFDSRHPKSPVRRKSSYREATEHHGDSSEEEMEKMRLLSKGEAEKAAELLRSIQGLSEESDKHLREDIQPETTVPQDVEAKSEDESKEDDTHPESESSRDESEAVAKKTLSSANYNEGLEKEHQNDESIQETGAVGEVIVEKQSSSDDDESDKDDGSEYTLDDIDLDDVASLDSGTASKENLTEGSDMAQSPTGSEPGSPSESAKAAGTAMKGSISRDSVISEGGLPREKGKRVGKQKGRQKGRGKGKAPPIPPLQLEVEAPGGESLERHEHAKEDNPVALDRKKRSRKSRHDKNKPDTQALEAEKEEEHARTPDSKGHKPGGGFFKKIFGRT